MGVENMHTAIGEQYVVDESGQATAVILPIASYNKLIEIIQTFDESMENQTLSDTPAFKELVGKGLNDIQTGQVSSWRNVWNDL